MVEDERKLKFISAKNLGVFNELALSLDRRFRQIKGKLPWIEPSINMIHLEAVRAYVFGSPLASIGSATYLLEHSLRMAIWDSKESGTSRKNPPNKIFDETLSKLLTKPQYQSKILYLIPNEKDRDWWNDVKNAVRNKVNHVDLPAIFRIANVLKLKYDYAYSGFVGTNSWDPKDPSSWGMFWHRFGDKLAADFLNMCTGQVVKLINHTTWKPDESWWISQKYEYESFFHERWDISSLQKSLMKIYDED